MDKSEALIEAYQHYVHLLTDELTETASFCATHGWKSSRYEEGEKLRKIIKQLEKELENGQLPEFRPNEKGE